MRRAAVLLCCGCAAGLIALPRAPPLCAAGKGTATTTVASLDASSALFALGLCGAAYLSGYATEGYEPHKF